MLGICDEDKSEQVNEVIFNCKGVFKYDLPKGLPSLLEVHYKCDGYPCKNMSLPTTIPALSSCGT